MKSIMQSAPGSVGRQNNADNINHMIYPSYQNHDDNNGNNHHHRCLTQKV